MTLEVLTSEMLHVRHGFFTRKGGASSGVFASLNCGHGSSDQSDVVTINRTRVAEAMQVTPDNLISIHQTHSATALAVDGPFEQAPKADGMATATQGIALAILTADCQPVLFADVAAGVVGAAHAGWKGALDGVLEATIDKMETLGAQRERITAIIGPSISQRAYEVGLEFFENFADSDRESIRFFASGAREGKYQFDLPSYGTHRLRKAGVAHAEWTRHCTYSDPDRFFSYRRSVHDKEADYGRLISVIGL